MSVDTAKARRDHYRENMRSVFGVASDLYYASWGEFFHLAIFEEGDDRTAFDAAFERTHRRYFEAIGGSRAGRILELACGGGGFAEWMAVRKRGRSSISGEPRPPAGVRSLRSLSSPSPAASRCC
jgi:hypothetical protein